MEIFYLLAFAVTDLVIRFVSGLLGVGGGFIMVPVQYWVMTSSSGIDPTIAMRVAFGTSLAVILPTALSGRYGHSCRGCVLWRAGLFIGFSGLAGAFVGGTIASRLLAETLQIIFGITVLIGALSLLFSSRIITNEKPKGNLFYTPLQKTILVTYV
ncbi:MAG: sulfite exporter TauE/SafE family protein [Methanotrichaceae archaeon]|nr:sulfite exporter TauE/SafE family protein [Methanotrichaceae archaeon]